jgi:NADH dehydrogenase
MILVVGSTGFVGRHVVQRLAAKGQQVRALVRPGSDAAKLDAIRGKGVTLVEGDLKDPASLRPSCEGIATVISTASSTISRGAGDTIQSVDRDGQLALVDAARSSGVRHFIFLSFSGNFDVPSPLNEAKRAVERRIQESGMTYTIVRPSIFMEVWLSPHAGFDPVGGKVRIYGTGEERVSAISGSDVAEYVAACVDNPAVFNQVIELGGPEALSYNTMTAMFERALGREVEKQYVPEAALEQQLASVQDPLGKTLTALALGVARGDVIDNKPALQRAPITLTPLADYIARVVRI